MGSVDAVFSFNPRHWPSLHAKVGKYPGPLQLLPWLHYERKMKKKNSDYEVNLIALEKEEWRTNRTVLDQVFSSIPAVRALSPFVSDISRDLADRLEESIDPTTHQSPHLQTLLYSFSNEVIGSVCFGLRLGNLGGGSTMLKTDEKGQQVVAPVVPEKLLKEFQDVLFSTFLLGGRLQLGLPLYMIYPTADYRQFEKSIEGVVRIGRELIAVSDEFHRQESSSDRKKTYPDNYLVKHMREKGQNEQRVNVNASTMFLAGSDSTTHTLTWLLYNLARFPTVQQQLREEVSQYFISKSQKGKEEFNRKNVVVDGADIDNLPLVRAAMRESMRLTPSAPGLVRTFDEDVVVGDYNVPKGTMVLMLSFITNKLDEHFPNANVFDISRPKPLPFSHLPFGTGPRACQAFRLAELEAYNMLVHLLLRFKWTSLDTTPVGPLMDLFIKPERTPAIRWEKIQ